VLRSSHESVHIHLPYHRLESAGTDDGRAPLAVGYYEAVNCTARKAVNLVNPHTGKIDPTKPDGSIPDR